MHVDHITYAVHPYRTSFPIHAMLNDEDIYAILSICSVLHDCMHLLNVQCIYLQITDTASFIHSIVCDALFNLTSVSYSCTSTCTKTTISYGPSILQPFTVQYQWICCSIN